MKNIIAFIKQKYKILIPVMVVFVLLVAIYFLYKEYKYDNYRNKQEVEVYQYFGGQKSAYTAIITYNLKNAIVDISSKKNKIAYNATPIYYEKENKIIFPKEMIIAFPLLGGSQYKLYNNSIYERKKEESYITTGYDTSKYEHFFLSDGKGIYFFPDPVTININDKEYKKLGSMSFIKLVGGYTMTYYDRENNKSEFLEIEGKKITVSSENINVNLSEYYFLSLSSKVLLAEPAYLKPVK